MITFCFFCNHFLNLSSCQSCVARSNEWQQRFEEGTRLWNQLQEAAKPVENWASEAEQLLRTRDDANGNVLLRISVCMTYSYVPNFVSIYDMLISSLLYSSARAVSKTPKFAHINVFTGSKLSSASNIKLLL